MLRALTILLAIIFCLSSCTRDNEIIEVEETPNETQLVITPDMLSLTYDRNGERISVVNGPGHYISYSSSHGHTSADPYNRKIKYGAVSHNNVVHSQLDIEFLRFENINVLDEGTDFETYVEYEQFKDIFTPGIKSYTTSTCEKPGVLIRYYDAHGERWSSSEINCKPIPVAVNYEDFIFEVIQSETAVYQQSNSLSYGEYVTLRFSCNLYNKNGEVMALENGVLNAFYTHINSPF